MVTNLNRRERRAPDWQLNAVHYRLLQGDEPVHLTAERNEPHAFGGEVQLRFADGRKCYISWMDEPVQHALHTSISSFYVPEAGEEHDVSESAMWAGLVGQVVSVKFVGPDNQMLEIAAAAERVLVCAFEGGQWRADALTVCRKMAPAYAA